MKKEFLVILFILGLFGVAFRPLQQDIPPRPSIRIDAGVAGQIDNEPIYSYCWPAAQNNNQCNFSTQLTPQFALDVTPEAVITVMIDDGPGNPSTLTATLSNEASVTTYNLEPSTQSIFDQANPLPQGENILQIDAVYENVAGKRAYVSYRFRLNVFTPTAGALPTEVGTQEVAMLPTEEATEVTTVEATAELETATAEATVEVTAEATLLVTDDAVDLIPTVEVLPTEEATVEATAEATEALPTEEATQEATVPPTATATTDLMGTSTALALTAQAGATQETVETEETEVAALPTNTEESATATMTSTTEPSATPNLTATADAIIVELSTATAASLAETQAVAPSATNTAEAQPTDTLTLAPTLTVEAPGTATSTPSATFTPEVAETQTTVPMATNTTVAGDLGISSEDAETALFALLQGDAQTANQFICPEQQTDPAQITSQPLPDNMSVGVTCEPEGDLMRCDLSVVIEIEGIDSPIEVAEVLRLPVVNGQLCGDDLSANAVSVLDSAQDVEATPGTPVPTVVPTETLEPGATARPTSTTIPLQEVELSATPTATTIAAPDAAPELQLVYAGQTFAPSGLSFCTETGCVDMPVTQGEAVTLTAGTAAQIRLVDSPRPEQVEIAFLNTSTLETVQSLTRSGDRLILFNVEAAPRTYFLRVSAAWQGSTVTYFFQVRVAG